MQYDPIYVKVYNTQDSNTLFMNITNIVETPILHGNYTLQVQPVASSGKEGGEGKEMRFYNI